MSSLRNAVKRKTHKERSQPSFRKRHGLLEKKQDYLQRARDYSSKRQRLSVLKQKAAWRNPDEFYFGMIKRATKDGIHMLDHAQLSNDQVKLIRSQNAAYLEVVKGAEAASVNKLKQSLHFIGEKPRNKHILFVDSVEEAKRFDKAERFNTLPEFADNAYNRPTKELLRSQPLLLGKQVSIVGESVNKSDLDEGEGEGEGGDKLAYEGEEEVLKEVVELRAKAYRKLYKRLERHKQLKNVLAHVQTHKHLSGKGSRMKIRDAEDGKPAVFRWKQERKR